MDLDFPPAGFVPSNMVKVYLTLRMLKAFLKVRPQDKIGNPVNTDQANVDPRQRDYLTQPRVLAVETKREAYLPRQRIRTLNINPKLRHNPSSGEDQLAQSQGKAEECGIYPSNTGGVVIGGQTVRAVDKEKYLKSIFGEEVPPELDDAIDQIIDKVLPKVLDRVRQKLGD